jgi:hypothetical protein
MCRKRVLPGQTLTAAIWKPPLESEHRMPTLCPGCVKTPILINSCVNPTPRLYVVDSEVSLFTLASRCQNNILCWNRHWWGVNTTFLLKTRLWTLYRHRGDQFSWPQYRHHSFEIISQHMQTHFCTDIVKLLCQEMRRTHPKFNRSKGMFNRLFPDQHAIWLRGHQFVHLIYLALMFPTCYPARLFTVRALGFQLSCLAGWVMCPVSF